VRYNATVIRRYATLLNTYATLIVICWAILVGLTGLGFGRGMAVTIWQGIYGSSIDKGEVAFIRNAGGLLGLLLGGGLGYLIGEVIALFWRAMGQLLICFVEIEANTRATANGQRRESSILDFK